MRRAHTKCDDAVKLSCLWGVRSSRSKVAEAEMSGQTLKKPRSEVRHKRCLVYKLIYKETFFLNRSVVSMLFWGTIMNSDEKNGLPVWQRRILVLDLHLSSSMILGHSFHPHTVKLGGVL